jgi:hypothetical protein
MVALLSEKTAASIDQAPFPDLLSEELGVAAVHFRAQALDQVAWVLSLAPNQLARRGPAGAQIDAALASLPAADAGELAAQLRRGLSVRLEAVGQAFTLLPDEVHIAVRAAQGWAAADRDWLVVLRENGEHSK